MVAKKPQLRGAKLERVVLAAAFAQIEAVGMGKVRVADIADRAGVHETSIYRRWKTLSQLLADALVQRLGQEVTVPDTGRAGSDLRELALALTAFLHTPQGAIMLRGTSLSAEEPVVVSAREEFWQRRLHAAEVIIRRGQDRGELRREISPLTVMMSLGGFLQLSIAALGQPPTVKDIDDFVDQLLYGIAVFPSPS